jgi:hypothetical protein
MNQKPPQSQRRGSLSRQRQTERVESARQQLRTYFSTLDPPVQKLLTDRPLTREEYLRLHGSPELRAQRDVAYLEYSRLAIHVPEEWATRRKSFTALAKFQESLHRGEIKTRGASRKLPEEREDTFTAERVSQMMVRLRSGWELKCVLKTAGGAASGDEEIRRELQKLEYDSDEVAALMKARKLQTAAAHCFANQNGRRPESVRVSLSRAKRAATIQAPNKNR